MANWTENNIPDLSGKVVIITGANIGLGYESARMMAQKGAEVIIASRTPAKGEAAMNMIQTAAPNAKVHYSRLDLADLESVRGFAEAFNREYDRLDVLMNNAGVMATPPQKTKDGFELQFGTNHLGHFALTGLLMERLITTPESRVVNVSSIAAERGTMQFDDLMWEQNYDRFGVYSQSKLANLLFTRRLNQRLQAANAAVVGVAAHPGVSNTNLSSSMNIPIPMGLVRPILGLMTMSAAEGALSQVRAAVAPDVARDDYYGPDGRMRGKPVKVEMPPQAHDDAVAERLWAVSEELTGITYSLSE